MRTFLIRGLLAGVCAAFVAFAFARVVGVPAVEQGIAFEEQRMAAMGDEPKPELVSRAVQSTPGLATGVLATGVALGGFFAIAFALAYGRLGRPGARATALTVAALGFVAVYLVPSLKYPANPPAVSDPATLNGRTVLYFVMILASVIAMVAAVNLARRLTDRLGGWNASVIAAGSYLVAMLALAAVLPVVSEMPQGFPANTVWTFRVASTGIQAILWATIGLVFGALTHRAASNEAARSEPVTTG